jgi:hypothetical protein
MQGEIHRSEGPKVFPDIPKYTEDSRETGFRERDRCLKSEFGEQVLTHHYPHLLLSLQPPEDLNG